MTGDGVFIEGEGLSIPVKLSLSNLPAGGLGSVLHVSIRVTAEETGMYNKSYVWLFLNFVLFEFRSSHI